MTVTMVTSCYHGYGRPSQTVGAFSCATRREAMAHVTKSIVNELSKAPFNFSLTVVGFNSLQPLQLLQVIQTNPKRERERETKKNLNPLCEAAIR